jgi:dTDP-4-amino-4,6-dideoxygalactose transaminase
MTTSEGGMVFARDPDVLSRIRYQRSHGMTTGTLDRQRGHAYSYDVITLGFNYRMDEMRAAMGMVQLEKLPYFNQKRREITAAYRKLLSQEITSVQTPFSEEVKTSAHLMPIILPDNINREHIMATLKQMRIQSSIHYPALHKFSYYQTLFPDINLPITESFCAKELTLPLHPSMTENDVSDVVQGLKHAIND